MGPFLLLAAFCAANLGGGDGSRQHLRAFEATDDVDPHETAEWRDALGAMRQTAGPARVRQIMDMLSALARDPAIAWRPQRGTPYVNTIPAERQTAFPGDLAAEERLGLLMRRLCPRLPRRPAEWVWDRVH